MATDNGDLIIEKKLEALIIQDQIDALQGVVHEEAKLKFRKQGIVDVSDHALIRFMERKMGIDLDEFKDELRASIPNPDGKKDLNIKVEIKGMDCNLIVTRGVLVTVI